MAPSGTEPWQTFVDVLRAQAGKRPDELAFRFLATGDAQGPAETLTFGALDRRARALAAHLADEGLAGQPAVLLYPPGLEFVAAFFGCLYAGAIAVPAYPPDPRRLGRTLGRLMGIVRDSGAGVVLTDRQIDGLRHLAGEKAPEHAGELGALRWIVTETLDTSAADAWHPPRVAADRPAMLQYTSGSTGDPRGVALGHDNLLANQALIQECFGHDPEELAAREGEPGVAWLPLFHDMGLVGHVLHPVYLGVTSVLMSPLAFLQRPLRWLEAVSAFRAHTSGGPGFAYDLCLRHVTEEERDRLDLSCWEVAYCGAEPIRGDTSRRFADYFAPAGFRRRAFVPCYGLAEATLLVTGGDRDRPEASRVLDARALEEGRVVASPPGRRGTRTVVGCGRPRGDAGLRIVHPRQRRPCEEGEVGEVWITGRSVARGYWRRPSLTREVFGAVLEGGDGSPHLRSGDLGFLWRDELYVTGRLKELIVVHGRNHYPADIEATVEASHPGIRRGCCAAFGLPAEGGEQLALVAEVDLSLAGGDPGEVITRARQAVEQEHGLKTYAVTLIPPRTLPKTSSGKPQRHACRTALLRGELEVVAGRSFDPARSAGTTAPDAGRSALEARPAPVQAWLARRLARAAGSSAGEIDPEAPLSTFGLGSLTLVEIAGELSVALGRPLSATLFYDHATVAAVARSVGTAAPRWESPPGESAPARSGPAAEPIAVIGMACRLPGGVEGPEDFWSLLEGGRDGLVEVPPDRWDIDAYHDPTGEVPGKMACRRGGFVEGIDRFDPRFFGMSLGEAPAVDPQQRLLMETCWRALESAGQTRERLAGSDTGVYVGLCGTEYGYQVMADERAIDAYSLLGTAHSAVVGRLSYWLGLEGPNFPVDTACSSSLVAVHLACQGLRERECGMALAAGVNVLLTPAGTIYFTRLGALSPDGICRPFDAGANGYVRGEGCGALVLKRLSDARRDKDPILALIRGSAVNQDGQSVGFTAPSGAAQRRVVGRALRMAGLEPGQVDYVEAHGTGTPVGDPIEINALGEVMRGTRERPLLVGSVKSNIGHLEGAAGIASLIKAVLMLHHDRVVPSLHFADPNPRVRWDDIPIRIARGGEAWGRSGEPRVIGVNAFGFSGTNAHVVLEQWRGPGGEERGGEGGEPRPAYLNPLSAHGREALSAQVTGLGDHLARHPDVDLPDLAWSLGNLRSHLSHRMAVVCSSTEQLVADLENSARPSPRVLTAPRNAADPGGITLLFTGQGAQAPGMGGGLYEGHPVFRDALDEAAAALDPHLDRPLLTAMFAPAGSPDGERIHDTGTTQPALFALEVALARVWMTAGVRPDILVGHSVGEVAAACVAGVFSLADGARLIAARGRLMGEQPLGAMVALAAPEAEVVETLGGHERGGVSIAALNTPRQTVISGPEEPVLALAAAFDERGTAVTRLRVSHAFHSPMMDPMLPAFRAVCEELSYHPPRIPIVGNVAGERVEGEIATPDYWVEHARAPVRFADGVLCAVAEGATTFVEIGPRPILSALGAGCLAPGTPASWIPSLDPPEDDGQVLLRGLGTLYVQGRTLDWSELNGPDPGGRPPLPAYPFQRRRYWIERVPAGQAVVTAGSEGKFSLSGRPLELPGDDVHRVLDVSLEHQPYLRDHVVHGVVVVPGTFFVAAMLALVADHYGSDRAELRDVQFLRPLAVGDGARVHLVVTPGADGSRFRIASRPIGGEGTPFVTHAQGTLIVVREILEGGDPGITPPSAHRGWARTRCTERLPVDDLYRSLGRMGIELGPSWRWTRSMDRDPDSGETLGRLEPPPGAAAREAPYHPAQLDNILAAGLATVTGDGAEPSTPRLPFAIDVVRWQGVPEGTVRCRGVHRQTVGEMSVFDLHAVDEMADACLEMEGFHARRAPRPVFLELAGLRPPSPVYRMAWEGGTARLARATTERAAERWIVVDGSGQDIGGLRGRLRGLQEVAPFHGLIGLFPAGLEPGRAMDTARHALALVHGITGMRPRPQVVWATRGAVAAGPEEIPDLATSVVWGLGRSWIAEELDRSIHLIDLPPDTPDSDVIPTVHAVLDRAGDERQVALRDGRIHVPRLVRMADDEGPVPLTLDGGTAVVTGGFGHLGRLVARRLVRRHGARGLLLIGRSAPGPEALALAEELANKGIQIALTRADVADAEQLRGALDRASELPPVRGVVHAAGVLRDAPLATQRPGQLREVLAPKVLGAWNLHRATEGLDLRLFALFSSIAAPLGSPGQGAYAAANAFLSGLARYRRAQGSTAHALEWGPWSGGGMVARMRAGALRRMENRGIHPLDVEHALDLFSRAIGRDLPRQVIADLDPLAMARAMPKEAVPPPLRSLVERAPRGDAAGSARTTSIAGELAPLSDGERRTRLTGLLRREVAAVVAVSDPDEIPLDRPLQELGLDSLTGAELRTRLVQATGIELPLMALFEHPTIGGFVDYLVERLRGPEAGYGGAGAVDAAAGRRSDPETDAPLSSGQRRLWFLDRLSPRKELYHVHLELEGRGPVSLDALRETLATLVRRHEALRTCFPEIDGDPRQVVFPPYEVELPLVDLAGLAGDEPRRRLDEFRRAQTGTPFDLSREAPVRFSLVRTQPDVHRLLITQHHIATDGWSLAVLIRELGVIYAALERGEEPSLPEPGRPFAHAAVAERLATEEGRHRKSLEFWKERLADLPVLALPTDRPRPRIRTYAGGQVPFEFSRTLSSQLLDLGRSAGATPFATVAALFAALLSRLTHQRDLALGTVHANRPDPADRTVMGFFVNTVVLRCDLSGDPDMGQVIRRVARTTVEALDHGAVPFDEVVRNAAPERSGEDNPLFRACVVQETPLTGMGTPAGLTIEPVMGALDGSVPGTAKFDLTLLFAVDDERLAGSLEYSADLFDEATVRRFVGTLEDLALSALSQPELPVARLDLWPTDARSAFHQASQGPTREPPAEGCVHRMFRAQVERTPDRVALRHEEGVVTFAQLHARANRIARLLEGHGVGPDRPVGLYLERSPDLVAAMLGILGAGGAYLPLDTENPQARLWRMVEDAELDVVITHAGLRGRLPGGVPDVLALDELDGALDDLPDTPPGSSVEPGHLAYVMFTSGSTGRPRGACITHANLANYVAWKIRTFPPEHGDRFLQKTPVGFDSSVGEIWYPLLTGTELVLARPGGQRDPDYLLSAIREHGITLFKAVPSLYHALLLAGGLERCPSLRLLFSGGEALSNAAALELKRITGARVVNLYGPAEATVSATCFEVGDEAVGDQVPIGRAIDNVSAVLLDEAGAPVPLGVVGEIHLGGAGVGRGYLNRPDLTAERFVGDPLADGDGGRLYRTGDLARWRDGDQLEFVGRRDRQVQLRGQRIELGEVEAALAELPGVAGCTVAMLGDEPTSRRLVGYVEAEAPLDEVELRERLADRLLPAMVPSRLVFMDALPRLPSGKVDPGALPPPPARARVEGTAPRTPTEGILAGIFARALELDRVGVRDDFFALGGHSLLAVRAMVEVQGRFPGRVALNDLFGFPTVEAMARRIDRRGGRGAGEGVGQQERLRRDVRLPLDISPSGAAPASPDPPRRILLTGATGFLGAHLLHDLLEAQDGPVSCLVRARDGGAALGRLEEALRSNGLWRPEFRDRLDVQPGDLTRRAFGIAPSAFSSLAGEVDAVLHAGAWVHHAHLYGTLRPANVGGTLEVIRLACTGRLKPVGFVSTLDVFPRAPRSDGSSWPEELVVEQPPPAHSGYARSKWVAERCLGLAAEAGVPLTIFRPGLIMGHGETGRIQAPDSWLVLLLQACLRLGRMPTGALPDLRMVPVDRVSRAIVARVLQAPGDAGVYHLTHPEPLTEEAVWRALVDRGYRLERVPYARWREHLDRALGGEPDGPLAGLAALLPPAAAGPIVPADRPVDDREGQAALRAGAGSLPSVAEQLAANLRYLAESGALPERPPRPEEDGE